MSAEQDTEPAGAKPLESVHDDRTVATGLNPHSGAASDTHTRAGVGDLAEFSRSLVDLGIIGAEELRSIAAATSEGVLGLSRALVQAGRLTPYQAAAVYQKKSRGLLIGNYIILDKIGQGGMGMVFKCRHRRLGRLGALKILPPSFARDRRAVLRFRREVEAAGRLRHPNVVAAVDADEDRGVQFLVMEYVEGRDLDHLVRDRGPMPLSQAIDCIIQAARGLEAAHAEGIVHRDIKPGNLMLDNTGTVRVLDLGLARFVDAANPYGKSPGGRLTESGMYMGTVDFMAPEQAEDSRRADHRADIYALGCSLYYLLTAHTPFDGPTVLKRLMAHLEQPAPSLRSKRPEAPAKLESVFQKMLAKRPEDRPQSMTELISLLEQCKAEAAKAPAVTTPKSKPELKVFNETPLKRPESPKTQRDPAIFARPTEREGLGIALDLNLEDLIMDVRSDPQPEPMLRPSKTKAGRSQTFVRPGKRTLVRRIPRGGGLIAAAGAASVLAAFFTWFIFFRADRDTTGPEAVISSSGAEDRSSTSARDRLAPASAGNVVSAPTFHDEFHTIFDGSSNSGWMLCNKRPLPRTHIQKDGLNPHGTGSYLVVYQEKLSDFELDFDYKLDKGCNSGVFLRVSDLADPVRTGIEVALDDTTGRGFGDSGAFYSLVAPEINAQKPARQWNHMTIMAQGPEISVVLNGSPVSSIKLDEWTVPGKRPNGSNHNFKNIAVANLARTGYVGFQDLRGNCWFNHVRLKKLSPGGVSSPKSIAASADLASRAISTSAAEPFVEAARLENHTHPWVESIRLSPDGKKLLTACGDKTARLWDIATGVELRRLWHPAGLRPVAYHPDGRRAVTGCSDGLVRLWNLDTGKLIRPLSKHPAAVLAVAISSDGLHVLSGGENNTLRLLEVETGREIKQFEGVSTPIWSVAISPDGRRVLAGGASGTIYVGETNSTAQLQTLSLHTETVWDLTFAPNSRHALSAGRDGRLAYWDLDSRSSVQTTQLDDSNLRCVAFDPGDRHVIFGGQRGVKQPPRQGILGFWDFTSNLPPRVIPHRFAHLGLTLLPHGRVATADDGGVARIWEPEADIAQARELRKSGKQAEALPHYDKAVAAQPSDARLLIERGRLLAHLGQQARADADFDQAARLASDNPQIFVDAGWWVAGPYPANFAQGTALETSPAPDPSKPAPSSGNEVHRWFDLETGMLGMVNISELFKAENSVAYAMAIVYVAQPREVAMLLGNDDTARIWNNGKQVFLSPQFAPADSRAVLITLEPGRNTILARVGNQGGPHSLSLRFGARPADAARAFADAKKWNEAAEEFTKALTIEPDCSDQIVLQSLSETLIQLKRWKEAAPVFEKIAALDPDNFDKQINLMKCYLVLKEYPSYRRVCEAGIAKYGKSQAPNMANNAIWHAALIPNAVPHYSEVIDIGRKIAGARTATSNEWNTFGAVLYRAGQYASSLTFLKKSIDAQKGKGNAYDWVFTAMARHRSRQPADREALTRARSLAGEFPASWQNRIELDALFEEAEQELKLPPTH
jgi:serine/threonine protein kinase/WD40 repeat protein/tetratricopeptide (TPR) repeat protein